jgi:translation initiation factor IF-3
LILRDKDFRLFSCLVPIQRRLNLEKFFWTHLWTRVHYPSSPHANFLSNTHKHLQKKILFNNQIKAKEVRLIDETGKQHGVVALEQALLLAREKELDLIQVTEKVEPPVCKIGQYGKFLYQQEKKGKDAKKQTGGDLKEVRLSFNISQHDLETRGNQAVKFLKKGDKVRATLRLKGRQKALEQIGQEKFTKLIEFVEQAIPIKVERELKKEPRGLSMIIAKK